MARRREHEEVQMDMTPMIDCVFQLIIFFFLVIDLQNQELELLVLPVAKTAVPDDPADKVRPIVNVLQDGEVIYRGKTYFHPDRPEFADRKKMKELLKYFADTLMEKKMDPVVGKKIPYDALLIRADEWTEMHHIAKIMEDCGNLEIMIWKVELAVGETEDQKKRARAAANRGGE